MDCQKNTDRNEHIIEEAVKKSYRSLFDMTRLISIPVDRGVAVITHADFPQRRKRSPEPLK